MTHTSPGSVSIPVTLDNGKNVITVDVEGILFQPISEEKLDTSVDNNTKEEDNPTKQNSSSSIIPGWIRTNAGWWANDEIDDVTFISGIQHLIKEGIISVSSSSSSTSDDNTTSEILNWIKNNADWWSQEMISDDGFLRGIEFLVGNGIIVVQ
ncbi:hypothetical protein [Nitrosopumilus sp.]|uniref:hypothetical protein n=1 Tax=Nitrosopumilus sp. TaxID=2024843 RepID=UPI0029314C23|nr:hypothetical protein [Nitrosopumilus sp.]